MNDDPLLGMVVVDQLERRTGPGHDPLVWDAEGWIGYDLNKLWIKTEGENLDSHTEEMELQVLYSRAVATYWDIQAGWHRDIRPRPQRDWLALGIKGLAPYFFDVDCAVFLGDNGRTSARLQAEYEIMLTQKLVLVPELEVNFFGKNDPETATGSGLATIDAGIRLRYEIRRQFAPYLGVNWNRMYGNTADYASAEGEDLENTRFVLGVRIWF